jgi:hypothetical protein
MSGRVFISHASSEAAQARAVADHLRNSGLSPLVDRERIGAGDSFLTFMEDALSTSDYFLLLWSEAAATRKWVRLEWEAALVRSVVDGRSFLIVGRLDAHPLPRLLAPRLFVDLHPTLRPGIDDVVGMWRRDLEAEGQSGKPVASSRALAQGADGVPIYVTSELFGVAVPMSSNLAAPAGMLLNAIIDTCALPRSLDHQGQVGVRFEYRLLRDSVPLDFERPLQDQGVQAHSVLWLECRMQPFAATAPLAGTLAPATFRGDRSAGRAMKIAQRRLTAAIRAADLGGTPASERIDA